MGERLVPGGFGRKWMVVTGGAGGGLGKKKENVRDVISNFFGTILSTFETMNRSSVTVTTLFYWI